MIGDLLIQRATISRWTSRVPGEDYTFSPDWQPVTTVACNVQEKGAMLETLHGRNVVYDAVAYFLPDADVRPAVSNASEGDRVTVGSKTYQVLAVTDQTGRGAFLKAYLKAV